MPPYHRLATIYAVLVVRGRWLVLLGLAVAVYAAGQSLPSLGASSSGGLFGGIPTESPAVRAQTQTVQEFGIPLLTRIAVVQNSPQGLSSDAQARVLQHASAQNQAALTGHSTNGVRFALPLLNTPGISQRPSPPNTAITYVFTDPTAGFGEQVQVGDQYASMSNRPDDHLLGVTGTAPLEVEQTRIIQDNIKWVEVGSIIVVGLIVGLTFRSLLVPLLTLLSSAIAYFLADRLAGAFAELSGSTAPAQLEPMLVALTLGVTTDYAIFFVSGLERRLAAGEDRKTAARGTIVEYLPIVLVAGLTVAAGVLALVVAQTQAFRAFGPGLATTVLVALGVSITLIPAALSVLGRWVFWPGRFPADRRKAGASVILGWVVRPLTHRWVAAPVVVVIVLVLTLAALPLRTLQESFSPISALPNDDPVRVAWQAAAQGFSPGILSPTEVTVRQQGIGNDAHALTTLQQHLGNQRGVAAVLGPAQAPLLLPQVQQRAEAGLFVAPDGNAARYLVVLRSDPLSAQAIQDLRTLQHSMPAVLSNAGVPSARVSYAGDTALGLDLVGSARDDLARVAVVIAALDLVLLVLFLRAVVAPLYLLTTSFLSVAATLGLATLLFQYGTQDDGLVFFVPFAAGALLVSLGSDYNIFSVGYIWREAETLPLRDALRTAVPRSNRAISAAGLALAASFAFVSLVPLSQFRQLAFVMCVGILLDAFVVRSFLVPALITLEGGPHRYKKARRQ